MITTSRRPTKSMRTLCKDLVTVLPSLKKVNRGKMGFRAVLEKAAEIGAEKVVIIDRWKGRPGRIRLFEIGEKIVQIPPQLYLRGIKLRREFKIEEVSIPRTVFIEESEGENDEIRKIREAFSKFFNLPKAKLNDKNGISFTLMHFSMDHENLIRVSFYLMPRKIEVGPRIRISHAVWDI